MPKKKYTFIDLFAGCGGLSLGLEQAGFSPVFVNEIEPQFCETYKRNRDLPDSAYYIGDIRSLNEEEGIADRYKDVTLVCGGPPCQGFSMANRQRVIEDPRNELYKEYLKFLQKIRPEFFIMENVRGMMSRWEEIKSNFEEYLNAESEIYQFGSKLFLAEDYGVPQHRERFIVIGNRIGVDPRIIFSEIEKQRRAPFVLKDALDGLPALGHKHVKGASSTENDDTGYTEIEFQYIHNEFYHFINGEKPIEKLYNHKNRYNNPRDIEIYRRLPQGANSLHESIADIMPYARRNEIFKDKYFKLQEDRVCKTITSHMKFDCNMYIHPWYSRGLTAREAARIQTFPDDFIFTGAQNLWYAQAGNAVPVKLAKAIGCGIMRYAK